MAHDRPADNSGEHPERSRTLVSPFDDNADEITPGIREDNEDHPMDDPTVVTQNTSSAVEQLLNLRKRTEVTTTKATEEAPVLTLRYRRTSVWLLTCYLPFLIVPWILVCIMEHRPPSLPSYYNQRGELCGWKLLVIPFWFGFVRILNSIASVLTVPITSALLAQGAVVFMQRRKRNPLRGRQKLNLRQTFALADRGWSDITILWSSYREKGTASAYLTAAAWLLILSM